MKLKLPVVSAASLALILALRLSSPTGVGAQAAANAQSPLYRNAVLTCLQGAIPTATTAGFINLHVLSTDVFIVNIRLAGVTPNASYAITLLEQSPAGTPDCVPFVTPGTLTTDFKGDAQGTFQIPRVAGKTKFFVSAFHSASDTARSAAVELTTF
jgi:hypothetical protein